MLVKCVPRLAQNSGTGRGMRLKTTAQSRSGVQLPRSVFRQKGTGFLRASIVVLFPFRRPPPSALALRLCQQLSASSGIVPARLRQPPAPLVSPQFLIVFQSVDGFFLLFLHQVVHTLFTTCLSQSIFHSGLCNLLHQPQIARAGGKTSDSRQVHVLTEHHFLSYFWYVDHVSGMLTIILVF